MIKKQFFFIIYSKLFFKAIFKYFQMDFMNNNLKNGKKFKNFHILHK